MTAPDAKVKAAPQPEVLTTFKGFDKDFKCRDFAFKVGETYEHAGNVEACDSGFHACEHPLSVLCFYSLANGSRFALVEQSGAISRKENKLASQRIKIKEEIVNRCGYFPYAPTLALDAKTATLDDMKRARGAVDDYITEVSNYEKCLLSLNKTIGPSMTEKDSDYVAMVFNRAQEERDVLSLDFNKLVDEYNAAHGIKTDPPKTAKGKPATAKPATTTTPATTKPKPATTTP